MRSKSKIESYEHTDLNKVIKWFINLRWIACFGVLIVLLFVNFKYNINIPYSILYSLNVILLLLNLLFFIFFSMIKKQNISRKDMSIFFNIQVCCDYIMLFLLIYFTGFLENPFSYYFVFHIMLTSFIFSNSNIYIYCCILIFGTIGVAFAEYFNFIPHFFLNMTTISTSTYYDLILIRVFGLCSTLIITTYLIISIKTRIKERGKKVEIELNQYKSLDKVKSNFILQVTHELRGPLAALKGYYEMVIKGITGKIGDKTKVTLQKANQRAENLITIIDEMIDYAYMKSEDEIKFDKTEINIKDIINANVDIFINRANQKNINFIVSSQKGLKLFINRDLLNIILSNLITNAIKYSLNGSKIIINADEQNNKIHFLVKDFGIGINPEELNNIFDEFYRTRKAREMERDGTGLGLSIIKKAVDALNGTVNVYSEVDEGTSFHIYIPIK